MTERYSEIKTISVDKLRIARYVIISPNPEDDVIGYMDRWAKNSGLLDYQGYTPRKIGWDFPCVSEEQQKTFGLRRYVSAYVIPEDFTPSCHGAEIVHMEADNYAMITVADPFSDPFKHIPNAYMALFSYIEANGLNPKNLESRTCFEETYEKDGVEYMDVYVPIDKTERGA